MRSLPADLAMDRLRQVLADGWRTHAASLDYVPEGGGGYHWKLTDQAGRPRFVTVDDLDDKDWLGQTRPAVLEGLGRAFSTAAALRHDAGLEFVVAPIATVSPLGRQKAPPSLLASLVSPGGTAPFGSRGTSGGDLLLRLDDRYTVSVFPYLAGRSHPFGPYRDERLRGEALDMIAALHQSTPAVRDRAPRHRPSFTGRRDLDAFLLDPGVPWHGGPFSDPARDLLVPRIAEIAQLTRGFDYLVDLTAVTRAREVITHGEPHPANLMSADGRLHLIDWDTAALAPPERDLSLIVGASGEGADRYQKATGREVEPAVITLYQVRWYLDDLASAIRMFRNRHRDTTDTRRWLHGLAPRLEQLPRWLDLVG